MRSSQKEYLNLVRSIDIYSEKPNKSRLEIFKSHDFVSDKKLLLYAGSSKLTNEFDHLSKIDDAISSGVLQLMLFIDLIRGRRWPGWCRFLNMI